jgi:hypothetical protein
MGILHVWIQTCRKVWTCVDMGFSDPCSEGLRMELSGRACLTCAKPWIPPPAPQGRKGREFSDLYSGIGKDRYKHTKV